MHIESLDQMRRHLEAGGFLTLDGQGRLETQGAVARFFQKIGDAFRSLSASGRAAMAERDAAVSRAVDEMIRRDALVNPGRMEIPRPAGRAAAVVRSGTVSYTHQDVYMIQPPGHGRGAGHGRRGAGRSLPAT
ncbi:hypothetical protein [Mailhella massiliensis]|uniref:hypothetical protein n=1 Tax=Mailhella massiliensis TaxID=1903261 RepID=UPI0011862052|nr:hypothetical protein [Mailhella massiliensis]